MLKKLIAVIAIAISFGAQAQTLVKPLQGGTGVANANTKTITLGGALSTGGAFTTTPANALTLTTTGSTNVTLPTSGTLATTSAANIPLSALATQATNTVVGNATSGSASPTALAVGTCSTASSALIWTTNSGFGCNTAITASSIPVGGITGLGTGVATALAVNIGTAGSFVVNGGALGSPSSVGTMPAHVVTGSLTTGSSSFDLLNTTATTVNFAGAATTLNIGAATGTLTVSNTTLAAKAGTFSTTLGVSGATTIRSAGSSGADLLIGTGTAILAGGSAVGILASASNTALELKNSGATVPSLSLWNTTADGQNIGFFDATGTKRGTAYVKNSTAALRFGDSFGIGFDNNVDVVGTLGVTGAVAMPGLATSSAATTGTVCWTTGTGLLNVDTTTTCLLSSGKYKEQDRPLSNALASVLALRPVAYTLRKEFNPTGLGEQVGFYAEDVARIDSRLVSLEADGTPHAVRYQQLTAVLAKAIQEQQVQINALKRAVNE